jgi:homoserine dehydrogenase
MNNNTSNHIDISQNVGLFGLGTVAKSLINSMTSYKNSIFNIAKICVKDRNRIRETGNLQLTYDTGDILTDSSINIIVELIDDAQVSFDISKTALGYGKDVVTANKKMLAENLFELHDIARQNNTSLLYEASVCGSIPIISTLKYFYFNLNIDSVSGIFNTSSQYVLSRMEVDNLSYKTAVEKTKSLGYAESDHTLDMEGYDTLYKLCILSAHAYSIALRPENILRCGIDRIIPEDIKFAKSLEGSVKLLGHSERYNNQVNALVLPAIVPKASFLHDINYDQNGILVSKNTSFGTHFYSGKGAGGIPTASAVLSDLYNIKKSRSDTILEINKVIESSNDFEIDIFLRLNNPADSNNSSFRNIKFINRINECSYYSASLNVNEFLNSSLPDNHKCVFFLNASSQYMIKRNTQSV